MLDYGVQVFFAALGVSGGALSLLPVAVVVAVAGLVVRRVVVRRAGAQRARV
jgi:hypothetical protein